MRLVDGKSPNEGRLEVCYFNHWGTVCDDNFGTEEAQLVCRELGFPEEGRLEMVSVTSNCNKVTCKNHPSELSSLSRESLGSQKKYGLEIVSVTITATKLFINNSHLTINEHANSYSDIIS